jgi:hypothetical protein
MRHDLDIWPSLAADAAERGGRRLCRVRDSHMSIRPGFNTIDMEIGGFHSSFEIFRSALSITKAMNMPLELRYRLESPLRLEIGKDPVEWGMI